MKESDNRIVGLEDIVRAHHMLREVIVRTPLQRDAVLSAKYDCNVYLKREDLQVVRSFKIRGAYNMIRSLSEEERNRGSSAPVRATMRRASPSPAVRSVFTAKCICPAPLPIRR